MWYPVLRTPSWQVITTLALIIVNTIGLCVVIKPQLHNGTPHWGVLSAFLILFNSLFPIQQTFWLGQIVVSINILLVKYLYTFFSVHDVARITFLFTILCTITTFISLPQILLLIILAIITWQQDLFNVRIILAMILAIGLVVGYHTLANVLFWHYQYVSLSTLVSHYTWCGGLFTSQQIPFFIAIGVCLLLMVLLVVQDYSFEIQRRKYPVYVMLFLMTFATLVILFPNEDIHSFCSAIVPIGILTAHFVDIRKSFFNNVLLTLLCAVMIILTYLLHQP